jgi:hypothetical protein
VAWALHIAKDMPSSSGRCPLLTDKLVGMTIAYCNSYSSFALATSRLADLPIAQRNKGED